MPASGRSAFGLLCEERAVGRRQVMRSLRSFDGAVPAVMGDCKEDAFSDGDRIAGFGAADARPLAIAHAFNEVRQFASQLVLSLAVNHRCFQMPREQFVAKSGARGRIELQRVQPLLSNRVRRLNQRHFPLGEVGFNKPLRRPD